MEPDCRIFRVQSLANNGGEDERRQSQDKRSEMLDESP
jgi:hypothetical protein